MSRFPMLRPGVFASVLLATLISAGCGGGGSSADTVVPVGAGSISGTVTKGPVANATVAAFGMSSGAVGAQIGTATTDADGNFSMGIGSYAGSVMLRAGGGTFRDEATGSMMSMAAGDVMTAVMPNVAAGAGAAGIQVTPVTGMAQAMAQRMAGGMTDSNIASANAAMGNYFSVSDILHVRPMNPLVAGSGAGASQDSRNYGMTLAGMSQYARSAGMASSSSMVTAMMGDAADGMMDGRSAGTQISMPMNSMMGSAMMASTAGTSGLATAMAAFMASSANVSGLTAADMAALMQKLAASSGKL